MHNALVDTLTPHNLLKSKIYLKMSSLQDVRMNTGGASDLSEQMMEWNTPIAVVEAVVAGKRASWAAMLEKGGTA